MSNRYLAGGLVLECNFELPNLIPLPDHDGRADVRVLEGETPAELAGAAVHGPNWRIAEGRTLLRVPGVARYLLEADTITIAPEPGGDPRAVALFLTGTVLGLLLHQRGRITLHASAVKVGDGAVLFCGPSAIGKSTLAVALARRGYPIVSDDICAIDFLDGGMPVVASDGRRSKLWAQAIEALDVGAMQTGPVRDGLDKHYLDLPFEMTCVGDSIPVRSLYWLRDAKPSDTPRIERLGLPDLALLVTLNAYRPRLVRLFGQEEAYMRAAADMASRVSAFNLWRERDLEQMDWLLDTLEAQWRGVPMEAAG